MIVKNLADTSFNELFDCFQLAFKNYFVPLPTDRNYYRKRWKASKVDFNLSYGMFDQEKLVGFIIHSIDRRLGALTAYNAGTGVIPEYRGNGIIASIYQHALKDLQQNHIEKSTLEVITKNEKALHIYEKIGFEKSKWYHCFEGELQIEHPESFEIKEMSIETVNWNGLPKQGYYSWDYQKESILGGNYTYFQVTHQEKPESFFIIQPENGTVAQFDCFQQQETSWLRLFSAIQSISPTIRVINVDERLTKKTNYLKQMGLSNHINQYEMELIIKSQHHKALKQ